MSLFLPLSPDAPGPRRLHYDGVDLAAPSIAPEVQERAAWVALGPDGDLVRRGRTGGVDSFDVRLFCGAESAADHGTPALVDLLNGVPVRLLVPLGGGRAAELGEGEATSCPDDVTAPGTPQAHHARSCAA